MMNSEGDFPGRVSAKRRGHPKTSKVSVADPTFPLVARSIWTVRSGRACR